MNTSLWRSDMASIYYGMCHTFRNPEKVDTDSSAGRFFLEPNITYKVLLHDPQFYLILINSLTFPRIWLDYKAGQNMQRAGYFTFFYISVTEHHLLNRPEKPCEEEEDYDFLECVKTSQARMMGCRPPWDIWSPHSIPPCQTVDQLDQYEKLDMTLYDLEMILTKTGCRIPCNYKVSVCTRMITSFVKIFPRNTKKLKIL